MFHGMNSPIGLVMPRLLEWVNDLRISVQYALGSRSRSSFLVKIHRQYCIILRISIVRHVYGRMFLGHIQGAVFPL
jgi:hypothetical protein